MAPSYSLVGEGDGKAGRKQARGGPVLQRGRCDAGPLAFGEGCEVRGSRGWSVCFRLELVVGLA